jgi:hypothetical protein
MLSAASLAVALPGRGSIASRSSVLSQLARFGLNPMPLLLTELPGPSVVSPDVERVAEGYVPRP